MKSNELTGLTFFVRNNVTSAAKESGPIRPERHYKFDIADKSVVADLSN
jgi:hypothetical protein